MASPMLPTRWLISSPDLVSDPNVFPLLPGQNFLALKSITFPATTVRTSATGREVRVGQASIPKWRFKCSYEFIRSRPPTTDELQQIIAFFANRLGQRGSFLFWDPNDHNVTTPVQIGVGDGATTTFQFQRQVFASGAAPFLEPVYAINDTPTVYVDGAPTTAFSVGSFGTLVFAAAPAAGQVITWTGRFLFLCRFSEDKFDAMQMCKDLWSNDGVPFESFKP